MWVIVCSLTPLPLGCIVDRETMVLIGQAAAQQNRGCSIQLGDDWVQSFRYETVTAMLYLALSFPQEETQAHQVAVPYN